MNPPGVRFQRKVVKFREKEKDKQREAERIKSG